MNRSHQRDGRPLGAVFLTAVIVCVILNPLNSSTISVALPVLLQHFHASGAGITWIVSGYYLGSAIAQPVMGKLGDVWGRLPFIYVGLALMLITALCAPLSPSLWVFVLWRVVQALGTSMIYPNAIALVRDFRAQDVGRVLGYIGMTSGAAIAIGPTVGGILMDAVSWSAIFWLNIPVSLIAGLLFWWSVPKSRMKPVAGPAQRTDWLGIALFVTTITAWLVWLNNGRQLAHSQLLLMVFSAACTVMLMAVELRQTTPVIPVRWFLRRQFAVSSAMTVLVNLAMYCVLYGIPVFLETVRHFSATFSGILMLAFAGVMSLASPVGGRFAQSTRRRLPLLVSGTCLLLGIVILFWASRLPVALIVLSLALVGLSFSISNVVIQQIVLESVAAADTGQASGIYTLLRYLGTIVSSVLLSASIRSAAGAHSLFVVLAGLSLVSLLMTFAVGDVSPEETKNSAA